MKKILILGLTVVMAIATALCGGFGLSVARLAAATLAEQMNPGVKGDITFSGLPKQSANVGDAITLPTTTGVVAVFFQGKKISTATYENTGVYEYRIYPAGTNLDDATPDEAFYVHTVNVSQNRYSISVATNYAAATGEIFATVITPNKPIAIPKITELKDDNGKNLLAEENFDDLKKVMAGVTVVVGAGTTEEETHVVGAASDDITWEELVNFINSDATNNGIKVELCGDNGVVAGTTSMKVGGVFNPTTTTATKWEKGQKYYLKYTFDNSGFSGVKDEDKIKATGRSQFINIEEPTKPSGETGKSYDELIKFNKMPTVGAPSTTIELNREYTLPTASVYLSSATEGEGKPVISFNNIDSSTAVSNFTKIKIQYSANLTDWTDKGWTTDYKFVPDTVGYYRFTYYTTTAWGYGVNWAGDEMNILTGTEPGESGNAGFIKYVPFTTELKAENTQAPKYKWTDAFTYTDGMDEKEAFESKDLVDKSWLLPSTSSSDASITKIAAGNDTLINIPALMGYDYGDKTSEDLTYTLKLYKKLANNTWDSVAEFSNKIETDEDKMKFNYNNAKGLILNFGTPDSSALYGETAVEKTPVLFLRNDNIADGTFYITATITGIGGTNKTAYLPSYYFNVSDTYAATAPVINGELTTDTNNYRAGDEISFNELSTDVSTNELKYYWAKDGDVLPTEIKEEDISGGVVSFEAKEAGSYKIFAVARNWTAIQKEPSFAFAGWTTVPSEYENLVSLQVIDVEVVGAREVGDEVYPTIGYDPASYLDEIKNQTPRQNEELLLPDIKISNDSITSDEFVSGSIQVYNADTGKQEIITVEGWKPKAGEPTKVDETPEGFDSSSLGYGFEFPLRPTSQKVISGLSVIPTQYSENYYVVVTASNKYGETSIFYAKFTVVGKPNTTLTLSKENIQMKVGQSVSMPDLTMTINGIKFIAKQGYLYKEGDAISAANAVAEYRVDGAPLDSGKFSPTAAGTYNFKYEVSFIKDGDYKINSKIGAVEIDDDNAKKSINLAINVSEVASGDFNVDVNYGSGIQYSEFDGDKVNRGTEFTLKKQGGESINAMANALADFGDYTTSGTNSVALSDEVLIDSLKLVEGSERKLEYGYIVLPLSTAYFTNKLSAPSDFGEQSSIDIKVSRASDSSSVMLNMTLRYDRETGEIKAFNNAGEDDEIVIATANGQEYFAFKPNATIQAKRTLTAVEKYALGGSTPTGEYTELTPAATYALKAELFDRNNHTNDDNIVVDDTYNVSFKVNYKDASSSLDFGVSIGDAVKPDIEFIGALKELSGSSRELNEKNNETFTISLEEIEISGGKTVYGTRNNDGSWTPSDYMYQYIDENTSITVSGGAELTRVEETETYSYTDSSGNVQTKNKFHYDITPTTAGTYTITVSIRSQSNVYSSKSFSFTITEPEAAAKVDTAKIWGTILIVLASGLLLGVIAYFIITGRQTKFEGGAPKKLKKGKKEKDVQDENGVV
ncbi:MAG: hypothetical protein LBM01_03390 [Christensenellaceae bacterium]|nr:hypothetical protein [Christensenellaceae bacterium]